MSLIYNLTRSKNEYSLQVSQDTSYKLYYRSISEEKLEDTKDLLANTTTILTISKDSKYFIKLEDGVDEVEIELFEMKHLENSLSLDIRDVICMNSCSGNSIEESLAYHKNLFNKIFTYQTLYVPELGENSSFLLNTYLEEAVLLANHNLQDAINTILSKEIIQVNVPLDKTSLRIFLYLYWSGLYFNRISLVDSQDLEEVEYFLGVLQYEEIVNCSSDLGIPIEDLEALYYSIVKEPIVYSFQMDGVDKTFDEILLGDYYTTPNTEEELLEGKIFTLSNIGRFGFVVENKEEDPYIIKDSLGRDITESFDYLFSSNKSYYLTKNYLSNSDIYVKFVKK